MTEELIYKIIYVLITLSLPTFLIWYFSFKRNIKQSTWFVFSGISLLLFLLVDLLNKLFSCQFGSCSYPLLFGDIYLSAVWDIFYGMFACSVMLSLGMGILYNWINNSEKKK